jgi:uncharacterized RDD family membrane protein YckC
MSAPQAYRGERLGLPPDGQASLAPAGTRLLALIVDLIASALIAALFVAAVHHSQHHHEDAASRLPGSWSLIPLFVDYVLGILLAGQTLGMRLFGLRLIRVDDQRLPVNPWRAVARTVLLFLFIPAVVWDKDGRGLHDRYSDTAVVRS